MSQHEIGEHILQLQKRLESVRNTQIRLTSRKETLTKNRDDLIEEIKAAGYDPANLAQVRDDLQKELEESCAQLDKKLTEAETILNSIQE
tara:strand:- start:182 stop:451 length:270 start_codon:yes stop_codon:yes gene_type:complete